MYYKLGQACVTNWRSFVLLQIRVNVVTNWCNFVLLQIRANGVTSWCSFIITNWDKYCCKLGQLLQIGATFIRKWGSFYKLGQNLLQIGAGITNQGNYYKLGCNNLCFVDLQQKGYDSIWRNGLFDKLYSYGVSEKFITLLENIYNKVQLSVRLPNGITKD